MIDILHAQTIFKEYVSHYDPENLRISLKITHIQHVVQNCKTIAENLHLSEEETHLAELIGLFHDLGRFEQVRIANTFSDKDSGIDHAQMSCKVLFEDGLIRKFIKDTQYDSLIQKAVFNHNKASIEPHLSEKELLFAKLIRDADKLDIFRVWTKSPFSAIFWYDDFDCESIRPELIEELKKHKLVSYKNVHNNADLIIIFCGYIYDLNFEISLEVLKKQRYLDTFVSRILEHFRSPKIHEQMQEVQKICQDYLDARVINI